MIESLYNHLDSMKSNKPNLFSPYTVNVSGENYKKMEQASHLIDKIMEAPSFIKATLPSRPSIAHFQPCNFSAMIGYDFHITPTGPKLIEINTNAGGLMTSALWRLRDEPKHAEKVVQKMVNMFHTEYSNWKKNPTDRIQHIAIVDRDPFSEFTIDDFNLTKAAFEEHGIEVSICRADQLILRNNHLYAPDHKICIDLVYNRSCDFYFQEEGSSTLRKAYLNRSVCVTPNPYGYGLLSDKRSLALLYRLVLSEESILKSDEKEILEDVILPTHMLYSDYDKFTSKKNKWFFKPINLHAGIGAFRGDKISRKKLLELNPIEYIVQETAKPEEIPMVDGSYKYDLRLFTHQNVTIDISSRLYKGRLTNFRKFNGGYTKVKVIPQI